MAVDSSPKSSIIVVMVALLLLTSAVSVPAYLTFEKCVVLNFAPPPPPTEDPKAIRLAEIREKLCRSISRAVYFPYRHTGKHSPQYLEALKIVEILKNNQYALNYYLRYDRLPAPPPSSSSSS